jgi:hypothetical protein
MVFLIGERLFLLSDLLINCQVAVRRTAQKEEVEGTREIGRIGTQ